MRFSILLAALVIALVTSCGGSSVQNDVKNDVKNEQKATPPDGPRVLADAATAMRTVTTLHFTIGVQGNAPEAPLRYADGLLSREGSSKGVARVAQAGQAIQLEFVIIGNVLYLRGPGGGFQKLPLSAAVAGVVYDPSVILNPDRGIVAVLSNGRGATTEAREPRDGVDSYRLRATFPGQSLSALVPGLPQDQNITGQVWIAVQSSRIVEAQFPTTDGTITVQLSDYDAPVEITAPA